MAGEVRIVNDIEWILKIGKSPWPLPDVLEYDETGYYAKRSESQIHAFPESAMILRGAVYDWKAA